MPDRIAFKKQQATWKATKATDVLTSDRDGGLARAGNDTSWQLIVEAVLTTCGQTKTCNSWRGMYHTHTDSHMNCFAYVPAKHTEL